MGDVIGDLNKRRGMVLGMDDARSGAKIVKAMVPLSEMFGYVTALRTITSGRATSSMEYDHHEAVSSSIAKAILEECKAIGIINIKVLVAGSLYLIGAVRALLRQEKEFADVI